MKNQRENERLHQLFSGIEVLAVNPAGQTLENQPESEIPAPPVAELEQPALNDEHSSLTLETALFTNPPPAGEQNSDGLTFPENDEIESIPLNEMTEASFNPTLPLLDTSNSLPHPLTSAENTIVEALAAQPLVKQIRGEKSDPADWRDVGIGIVTGIIVTGIILASTSQRDIFNNPGRFILLGWEVLCGIVGAVAAKSSKKTRWAIWFGAIQWTLVPVWIVLFILLLIYLLTFTNLFVP